jgi:hypothetical protein
MEDIHGRIGHTSRVMILHVIGQVVQVKKIIQEVTGNQQLRIGGIRIGGRCQQPTLKALKASTSAVV